MAVQFILGRAGTGKTHHCLTSVRRQLQADPIDGPRLILLVPEQAALQTERALLEGEGGGAAHRAEALSFRRLAYKVLESTGGTERTALSESARTMVLRHLVHEHGDKLRYFRRVDRLSGFLEKLGATITELMEECIAPEELTEADPSGKAEGDVREGSEEAGPGDGPRANVPPAAERNGDEAPVRPFDSARRAKLADIARLYRAYLDYLGDTKLDPSQYFDLARERIARCGWLHGASVWVDGFASLSRQETGLLVELGKACAEMEICLLGEAQAESDSRSDERDGLRFGLFRRLEDTREHLERAFSAAGLTVLPARLLNGQTWRFRGREALERIEAIWGIARVVAPSGGSGVHGSSAVAGGGMELVETASRREEVEYAVSRICEWVRGEDGGVPHRFRDAAIIVRDLDPYHDLISAALASRGIPYFIDRRRPMGHHPLVELLRCGANLLADDFPLEVMRTLLKTGLLPLEETAADELENALVARGLAGLEAWRREWPAWTPAGEEADDGPRGARERDRRERVNAARRAVLAALEPWLEGTRTGTGTPGGCSPIGAAAEANWGKSPGGREASGNDALTGLRWAEAIRQWVKHLHVAETLSAWSAEAEGRGETEEAEEHRQTCRDVVEFLNDLERAFETTELSREEFAKVIEQGLASLSLGLAPPMVDQVLVGSIERSRHPNVRSAVLMGFQDGMFPRRAAEDSILHDEDRTYLRGRGLRVGPPSRDRQLDERLLAYIALTRASENLVVTWARADEQGAALRASPYVEELREILPELEVRQVGDPIRTRDFWDIQRKKEAVHRVALEMRSRPALEDDERAVRGSWNALYEALRGEMASDAGLRTCVQGLEDWPAARLTADSIQKLHQGRLRVSVSQLESYAACPFQHFAAFLLKLEERPTAELEAVDMGRVHHAVLERVVRGLMERRQDFAAVDEEGLRAIVEEACGEVSRGLEEAARVSQARDRYRLRRTAEEVSRILRSQRRIAGLGKMRPAGVELPFGFDEAGSLPGLMLSTPKGRSMVVRGYIDRVDLAELSDELLGIVIDYKRTRQKTLDLGRVYHGLSLQLPAYLLVLAARGHTLAGRPVRPVGAFFLPLERSYQSVAHPEDASRNEEEETEGAVEGAGRPRGLLLSEAIDVLDETSDDGGSKNFNYRRKKDGGIARIDQSDAADRAGFEEVMNLARRRIVELGDRMIDGMVEVKPYRMANGLSPCGWCAVRSVCRFEFSPERVRFLGRMKRSEVMGCEESTKARRHEGTES